MKLIGPFSQIITMSGISLKGALKDEELEIIENGGILIENGMILKTGNFNDLKDEFSDSEMEDIEGNQVLLTGFADSHTHICFRANRSKDFALRLNGKTYSEIAESGERIWSTVTNTRMESK